MVLSRYTQSFVGGVLTGCAAVTLLLLASSILSKGIYLISWDGDSNEAPTEDDMIEILMDTYEQEGLPSPSPAFIVKGLEKPEPVLNFFTKKVKVFKRSEPTLHHPKKHFLTVVVTSSILLERTANSIMNTWGKDTPDYRIVVGTKNDGATISNLPNILKTDHDDFPAFPYLSLEEIGFVLDLVRQHYLTRYRWFFITTSNVYISIQRLRSFLTTLDPNSMLYVGNPSKHKMPKGKHYCNGGPGILLSHTALKRLEGQVTNCLNSSSKESGYVAFGKCVFSRLHRDCQLGTNVSLESYFMYDGKVISREPSNLWKPQFENMITLYPIRDNHHMEAVHAFSLSREISNHQTEAIYLQTMLNENSICVNSSKECPLPSPKISAMTNYSNFSMKCQLFKRGYIPELRRKVVNWEIVEGTRVYNSWDLSPQSMVQGDFNKELQYVANQALAVLKQDIPGVQLLNVVTSYVRYRGSTGREYILDLELKGTMGPFERRVSLLFPHEPKLKLLPDAPPNARTIQINFIVPLKSLSRAKLGKFQKRFYLMCLKKKENCKIIYILFSASKRELSFLKAYLARYKRRYSHFRYDWIHANEKFNWSRGYELGMSKLANNDLAFIVSTDLSIAEHFMNRCRRNTLQGTRIYYPEIFKYYNMRYVYTGKRHPRHYDYIRQHGHWASDQAACIYKSDFVAIGGFSVISQWEIDPHLIQARINGTLEVMKAPDPGISRWYEQKHCDSKLPPAQFSSCVSARSDNLGDRISLANYLLLLETKCGQDDHKS